MGGPHPAVAAARAAVRACVADLSPGATVLVACSGGPDSLALAAATAFVAPRLGLRAAAVTVDHGLQEGSAVVAAGAVRACLALGLEPARAVAVTVDGPGGPEAAARDARYAALDAAADDLGAVAVLLGHTLDDQAESVLLGLARGSGARSLAGMAPVRGRHRRPFLRLRRAETAAACTALGLEPWHDPTNDDVARHRRAAVRAVALPALEAALGPGVVPALARTADLLRDDADALDALAAAALARAGGGGGAEVDAEPGLDVAVLAAEPAAVRGRVLRAAAVAAGCPPGDLARVHVEELDRLVTAWHGQGPVDLPGHVCGARTCGRLCLRSGRGTGTPGRETGK